jgi:hypothetical protein
MRTEALAPSGLEDAPSGLESESCKTPGDLSSLFVQIAETFALFPLFISVTTAHFELVNDSNPRTR